jgi:hypothetical protein
MIQSRKAIQIWKFQFENLRLNISINKYAKTSKNSSISWSGFLSRYLTDSMNFSLIIFDQISMNFKYFLFSSSMTGVITSNWNSRRGFWIFQHTYLRNYWIINQRSMNEFNAFDFKFGKFFHILYFLFQLNLWEKLSKIICVQFYLFRFLFKNLLVSLE